MDDPDAIWKPGYDGPPPIVRPTGANGEGASRPTDRAGPDVSEVAERDDRSRSRRFGVGLGLALVLVAAVVVVDPLNVRDEAAPDDALDVSPADRSAEEGGPDERSRPVVEQPDPSVFGGPAGRRLPGVAAPLWSIDIEANGDHFVEVIGRELVIAAVAETSSTPLGADAPVTTLVALDALTGEQRWMLRLTAHPSDVTVIGAVDDVLVLELPGAIGPTVTGLDVMTGETRWSDGVAPNDGHVGLVGTPLIARLPSPPDRLVSLIDATSGREVGAIVSDPTATGRPGGWSTDRRGTWYVIDDGEVVAHDLRAGLGETKVIGRVDDVSKASLIVDDRLAVVADSGLLTLQRTRDDDPVTVSADVPEPVGSLTSVAGSNFVVTAPGSIVGASLQGDTVDVTWALSQGALVEGHPVAGGTLLEVATRSGAGTQFVDGLTGETVEHLTMMPGALNALVVAGDGFVVLQASEFGAKLEGLDLDGTERWSIAGAAPVIVGDRIVVRATSNAVVDERAGSPVRRLRIAAYGDAD